MKKYSMWFTMLVMSNCVAMVLANLLASVAFSFGPFALAGGFVAFPITYVISDVISEAYGYKASRRITILAQLVTLGSMMLYFLMQVIIGPFADTTFGMYDVFKAMIATTPFIFIGGIVGSQLGGWINDIVFKAMKHKHLEDGVGYFARTITSSLVGELVDSTAFILIAFLLPHILGPEFVRAPLNRIFPMIYSQWLFKIVVETVLFPVTVWLKNKAVAADAGAFEEGTGYGFAG